MMKVKPDKSGDPKLIDRFVESWAKLDDLWTFEAIDPVAAELCSEKPPASDGFGWRPLKSSMPSSALATLYSRLPAPFPPLYELLILSYRWAAVDLRQLRLLPNPPGSDFSRLEAEVRDDPGLTKPLHSNGFIQFGRGPSVNYDPVCFDTRRKLADGDFRIVQLDHETILCHSRLREVTEVAPSFRDLVHAVITEAQRASSRSQLPSP